MPGKHKSSQRIPMLNRTEPERKVLRADSSVFARKAWVLPVYFLASTFDRAMRKLEQVLQFLQKKEERLWFWGVEYSDDPNFSEELVRKPDCGSIAAWNSRAGRPMSHSPRKSRFPLYCWHPFAAAWRIRSIPAARRQRKLRVLMGWWRGILPAGFPLPPD